MNRMIVLSVITSAIAVANAENVVKKPAAMTPAETAKAEMMSLERRSRRHGGLLAQPNTKRGKIVFVNEQNLVASDTLENVSELIRLRDKINVEFVENKDGKTTADNALQKRLSLGADVIVFISDAPASPNMMLTAPEGGWSIINASAVCKDARNDAFKITRMQKMAERGFYCAAGALNSQYPDSLMSSVRQPADLDKLATIPPVDVIARTIEALKGIGVTPQEYATYRQACQEGWAPAPTNDIQKAIWDKIHAAPTNPIKIKFDPATDGKDKDKE